jgi:pyruvate ferredoxin oxidoreductase beta subunit/2-oxoisovalerate ferredoxin oxidoreductase beta subunit
MSATTTGYDPHNIHLPDEELVQPGHLACPGCGAVIGMRIALKALGKNTVVVIPACCWGVLNGPYPFSALKVPVLNVAFATAAISASGVRAAFEMQGREDVNILVWAGDGGTFDIGLQSLSGAVERNDNMIYVCYDNEAYMNTGIQRSSATPYAAWTTTTPANSPKREPKKNIVEILAAHGIPYAATASIAYPDDFFRKMQKAKATGGARFIHLWVPCPTGHKSEERNSVRIARLAVETGVFPLYEVEDGIRYTINHRPAFTNLTEYLNLQGRFRHLNEQQIENMRRNIEREWKRLEARVDIGRRLEPEPYSAQVAAVGESAVPLPAQYASEALLS